MKKMSYKKNLLLFVIVGLIAYSLTLLIFKNLPKELPISKYYPTTWNNVYLQYLPHSKDLIIKDSKSDIVIEVISMDDIDKIPNTFIKNDDGSFWVPFIDINKSAINENYESKDNSNKIMHDGQIIGDKKDFTKFEAIEFENIFLGIIFTIIFCIIMLVIIAFIMFITVMLAMSGLLPILFIGTLGYDELSNENETTLKNVNFSIIIYLVMVLSFFAINMLSINVYEQINNDILIANSIIPTEYITCKIDNDIIYNDDYTIITKIPDKNVDFIKSTKIPKTFIQIEENTYIIPFYKDNPVISPKLYYQGINGGVMRNGQMIENTSKLQLNEMAYDLNQYNINISNNFLLNFYITLTSLMTAMSVPLVLEKYLTKKSKLISNKSK